MRLRAAAALGTTIVTATTIGLIGPASARPAATAQRGHAGVTRAARHGGPVIVELAQQFHDLKVNKQGGQRRAAARASQRALLAELRSHGATNVRSLVSVNAVAATVSAAEIARLRTDPAVALVQRDMPVRLPVATPLPAASVSSRICPTDPAQPLLEPEALGLTHFLSQPERPDDAATIATGRGVRIGLTGVNRLAGNPNFIRPDGEHVVVDSPTPDADDSDFGGGGDEWYGDASAISGQGTVTYDFSHELPYSNLPAGCTFKIVGIAPGASLVDTGYFGQGTSGERRADGAPRTESEAIAGLDHAAIDEHVSVVSESYGFGAFPGQTDISAYTAANDELVASGITVVESSGDSGVGGTVEVPAYDPLVIDAGATTSLRLNAQAWGYRTWQSDQMAALSSGGTTPDNNVVDLVAPGFGGEATCSPASATCPQDTLTEAFGGTSQSAPFIAGAAADVIQAYADSHGGSQPTPALVKQILTGSAHDIGAPSEDQGSGLLDVYAAVRAAQQEPGSTVSSDAAALVPSPTQVNVTGLGGSSHAESVSLYNASDSATTVHGTYRRYSAPTQIGSTTTEPVSAPRASQPRPAEGATAAAPVTMDVPSGLSQLGVDMITPNPRNNAILSLLLFDPKGRLAQVSYDYSSTNGKVSNNEHVAIDHPMAGTWTAKIVWNNGRSHLQDPPPAPGNYRSDISVRFTGRHAQNASAGAAVTIPAHDSASVPLSIKLSDTPGDDPEAVRFVAGNGATTSVPVTRRTLIPSAGGDFTATLGSSVARGFGPLKSFKIDVPAGEKDLRVTFDAQDTSANNILDYFVVALNGIDGWYDRTPSTTPQGADSPGQSGRGAIVVADPPAGEWTVQVMLDLTASGHEFTQDVVGNVSYDTARVQPYDVPDSAATTIDKHSRTTLQVGVTNTTGVGRTFALASTGGDVRGVKVYIAAGATALVTGTLLPQAHRGDTVSEQLVVLSYGSPLSPLLAADGFFFDTQTLAVVPLSYTVGPAAAG